MDTIHFRPATPADYEAICKLVSDEDELFLVYPAGRYPFSIDQLEQLAAQRKALTVAIKQGQLVGFANLYDIHENSFGFIGNVVIDKTQRGQGLGKAMVIHMLGQAVKLGLGEIRISVFSDNLPALLLYSSLDFIPYAIEERKDPRGQRTALIHMRFAQPESQFHKTVKNDL